MLARSFQRIKLLHIYREANRVVDYLVRIARDNCNGLVYFETLPIEVVNLLIFYVVSRVTLRLVYHKAGDVQSLDCSQLINQISPFFSGDWSLSCSIFTAQPPHQNIPLFCPNSAWPFFLHHPPLNLQFRSILDVPLPELLPEPNCGFGNRTVQPRILA